jgi:glycosyltransferase involved in cell wall biosynthesis
MPDAAKHLVLVMINLRPGRDGASSTMMELMYAVRRLGFKATVINFLADEPQYRALLAERMTSTGAALPVGNGDVYHYRERDLDCLVRFLPFTVQGLVSKRNEAVKTIMETIRKQHIDYVLTSDRTSVLAAHLLGIPGCHFFRSVGNIERMQHLHPAYLGSIRSRDCTVGSAFLQGKLKELLNLDAAVINPVIDFDAYVAPRDTSAEAIGFYASGSLRYKGDEVVNEITRKMPGTKFIIIGKGYRQFAPLPANVMYWGQQRDMKEFYRQIKLILVPSLVEEGFSRMILEAAANGIPAIANRLGGIPEALGDSGVLINIDDAADPDLHHIADGYVNEIKRLADNSEAYETLSEKARLRARQHASEQEDTLRRFFHRHVP